MEGMSGWEEQSVYSDSATSMPPSLHLGSVPRSGATHLAIDLKRRQGARRFETPALPAAAIRYLSTGNRRPALQKHSSE